MKKLVLSLCIEEGEDEYQHSFAEVEVKLRPGLEQREILDALQRGVCSVYEIVKEIGNLS